LDTLIRIKQLVLAGKTLFTSKAQIEMERDALREEDVREAIINAPSISKTIRSRKKSAKKPEYLHIIHGLTYSGLYIYTKGKISHHKGEDYLYVIISSKRDIG